MYLVQEKYLDKLLKMGFQIVKAPIKNDKKEDFVAVLPPKKFNFSETNIPMVKVPMTF